MNLAKLNFSILWRHKKDDSRLGHSYGRLTESIHEYIISHVYYLLAIDKNAHLREINTKSRISHHINFCKCISFRKEKRRKYFFPPSECR